MIDRLWIVHPALTVVLIYPLIRPVRREIRYPNEGKAGEWGLVASSHWSDQSAMGRWLSAGVVVLSRMALRLAFAFITRPGVIGLGR